MDYINKNKKIMKKIIFVFIIGIFVLTSCQKEFTKDLNINKDKTMNEMVVSENFDWKTTKDYIVDIDVNKDGIFYLQSDEGVNYLKYNLFIGDNNIKITLPAYEKYVYLIFKGEKVKYELISSKINYEFI